ncbi:MAG TPA: hypothetical protein VJU61_20105 [Polyangiaceae bacterium]|nr:hypothetical protein [Polyangiaceae bacterium]
MSRAEAFPVEGKGSWLPRRQRRPGYLAPCLLALYGGSLYAQSARAPDPSPPTQSAELAPTGPAAREVGQLSDDPAVHMLLELAKGRFNQGVLAQDAASIERALDALELGMALSPAPGLLFNAARVEQQLGHCAEATDLYQRFLAGQAAGAGRERTERQLEQLGACDAAQLTRAAWVLPGLSHGLHAPAVGSAPYEPPVSWTSLEESLDAPETADTGRIVSWSLVGAAGVCAVLTGVFFAQAYSAQQDIDDLQNHPEAPDAGSRLTELQQQGQSAQRRAQIFGVLTGTLGLAGGIGLWWTSRAAASPERGGSPAGLGGVAATWTGQF